MWREPTTRELVLLGDKRKPITKAGTFVITLFFLIPAILGVADLFELISEPDAGSVIGLVAAVIIAGIIWYGRGRWKKAMSSDIDERSLRVSKAVIIRKEVCHFDEKPLGGERYVETGYDITVHLEDSTEEYTVRMSYSYGNAHKVGDEVLIFGDKSDHNTKYMFLI